VTVKRLFWETGLSWILLLWEVTGLLGNCRRLRGPTILWLWEHSEVTCSIPARWCVWANLAAHPFSGWGDRVTRGLGAGWMRVLLPAYPEAFTSLNRWFKTISGSCWGIHSLNKSLRQNREPLELARDVVLSICCFQAGTLFPW